MLIKWWPKFNFFEKSVFAIKGLIDLEPPKPPKPDISELLKEFTSKVPKEDLSKLIVLLRQEEESGSLLKCQRTRKNLIYWKTLKIRMLKAA